MAEGYPGVVGRGRGAAKQQGGQSSGKSRGGSHPRGQAAEMLWQRQCNLAGLGLAKGCSWKHRESAGKGYEREAERS